MSKSRRSWPWLALLGTFVVVVVVQLIWVDPGPFTVDEVLYHRMTHELVTGGGFFLHNGYEDVQSPELITLLVQPTAAGKLASQYPYGSPTLGAPLYALIGLRAPFILNALALALSLVLCHRIAWQLLRDRFIALVAPALLTTTFFTEYGLAAWPHMTAVATMLAAFALGLSGHQLYDASKRRALGLYLASGACIGLGATLRLDAVLCAPAVVAPLLVSSPTRLGGMIALGAGMVPAIAYIVVTNYVRWGALTPISYGPAGHSPSHHIPYFIALACVTAALWAATRPQVRRWARAHARGVIAVGLGAVLLAFVVRPRLQRDLLELMTSFHAIVSYIADLRVRPNAYPVLDQGTTIQYAGALKKALLQSAPFCVLVAVPIMRALRDRDLRTTVAWLLIVPISFIGFFGAFAWHGGMCINLRYLLPALPFLCILAAFALRDLIAEAPRGWRLVAAIPIVPAFVFYMTMNYPASFPPEHVQELCLLTVPILLAIVLLIALIRWHIVRGRVASLVALCLAGAALGWTLAASIEDARWSTGRRARNFIVSDCTADRIADHSLVVTEAPDALYGVVAKRLDVRIAAPIFDNFETTHELISWHLANGRRAYAVVGGLMWKLLRWYGALDGFAVDPIARIGNFVLGEIRRARPGEPSAGMIQDIKGWPQTCGPDYLLLPFQFDPRFGPSMVQSPRVP